MDGAGTLNCLAATDAIPGTDFGDAPDPTYPTLLASNGAAYTESAGGPMLGTGVDFEADGQPSAGADGDDLGGADDEDGVTFPNPLVVDTNPTIAVTSNFSTTAGLLDAWVDFNADGDWADAGEQVLTSFALSANSEDVPIVVPAGATLGNTLARFRLGTLGGLAPTGLAADGEVEDYQITIVPPTTLTVTKVVENAGGGTLMLADFPLFIDGNPTTSGQAVGVSAGPHTVSETSDPNYTAVISGACAADGTITLNVGDVLACTITNTFVPTTPTVTKVVENAGGGTLDVADFPLFIDDNPTTSGQAVGASAGPHTVSETSDPNYTAVISGACAADGTITLNVGDTLACTITNTFVPTTLTVTKVVENAGGGTLVVADFPLLIDGSPATSGKPVVVGAGAHTVSETPNPNYTAVISGDCAADGTITLSVGDTLACTITNTFVPTTLTVTKVVENAGGGTLMVADFPLLIDGSPATSGKPVVVSAGAHIVSETSNPNYTAVISGDCAADGSVTLSVGESLACTITNTFVPNALPVAQDDAFTVAAGGTIDGNALVDNGSGPDSDPEDGTPPDGDVTLFGPKPVKVDQNFPFILNTDGSFSYTHDGTNPPMSPVTFEYDVADSAGATDRARVSITVVATGTITITKVIESSMGGPANNPATPSLEGFGFEVREAGMSTVVASGTTNTSGMLMLTVPVGNYDVVESNALGHTDATGPVMGVVVATGGNTSLTWTNKQLTSPTPPSGGGGGRSAAAG